MQSDHIYLIPQKISLKKRFMRFCREAINIAIVMLLTMLVWCLAHTFTGATRGVAQVGMQLLVSTSSLLFLLA